MKKNNNTAVWKQLEKDGLANVQAVEIETSAQDSGQWVQPLHGGRNVFVHDKQFRPTVDATVYSRDGKKQHRQVKFPKSYYNDPRAARQVANEEAQAMWKTARSKGIPVIMKTSTHKQHANITKNAACLEWEHEHKKQQAEDAYFESPKGKMLFVLFSIVTIFLASFVCYGATMFFAWLG